jgi:hypothetical protein
MKLIVILLALALPLSGCAGLSVGGISGTSTIDLVCGTTSVHYSAGLIPQMQPVTATAACPNAKTGVLEMQTASITPGMDIATLAALVKQNMAMKGEIMVASPVTKLPRQFYLTPGGN